MAAVAAERGHDPTDHRGGVMAGGLQQGGHQSAGGGLAVAAGHGDRGLTGDQGGKHIRAVAKGKAQPAGFLHLRVALRHGRAEHHQGEGGCRGGTAGQAPSDGVDGGGVLFVEDANAGLAQGRGHGVVSGVGAADAEAAAGEDPRQGRHADPTHADEMERLLEVELQAQERLRRSAENTAPDGCCRAPMSYEFHRCLRSPHLGPVRGAGSGSGRAVGVMGHRPLPALGDGPEIQLRGVDLAGPTIAISA